VDFKNGGARRPDSLLSFFHDHGKRYLIPSQIVDKNHH